MKFIIIGLAIVFVVYLMKQLALEGRSMDEYSDGFENNREQVAERKTA
ncbi:MAG: hypothetical protein ACM3UZ_13560 [Acidobacteriota bacterium]